MDWPKLVGYVGLTSIVISLAAHIASRIVPEFQSTAQLQDLIRWSGYLWAYASVVMGIFLMKLTNRTSEVCWGALSALLCLLFQFGMFFAVIYFFHSYAKIDQMNNGLPP